jgi:hypothetical protein
MAFESRIVLDEVSHLFTGYDGNSPDVSGFTGKARVFFELPDIVSDVVDLFLDGLPWKNVTEYWELSGYNADPNSTAGLTFILEDPLYTDDNGKYKKFRLENIHNQWITEGLQHFAIKAERSPGFLFGDKFAQFTAHVSRLESDVLGCTNPNAENYNPDAVADDGSCQFEHTDLDQESDDELLRNSTETTTEYTMDSKPLNDILPMTPLVYDGKNLNITLDLRNITYKPEPLAEILDPEFKSY